MNLSDPIEPVCALSFKSRNLHLLKVKRPIFGSDDKSPDSVAPTSDASRG